MHILWTILIGFVAGLVAKMLTPGRDPSGFFITAAIGIAGSVAATYVGQAMGWYQAGESAGFIGGVLGAIVLLLIYHLVRSKTTGGSRRRQRTTGDPCEGNPGSRPFPRLD
jgi:uncharacterized membrane protein YeaQ/YmgE (transglycosylase-associated protein family)